MDFVAITAAEAFMAVVAIVEVVACSKKRFGLAESCPLVL